MIGLPAANNLVAWVCQLWRTLYKRHTHATLLLQQGVNPKEIQERLVNSNIGTTLDSYSHLFITGYAGRSSRSIKGYF